MPFAFDRVSFPETKDGEKRVWGGPAPSLRFFMFQSFSQLSLNQDVEKLLDHRASKMTHDGPDYVCPSPGARLGALGRRLNGG
jgi:hypothetical protein